LVICLGWEWGVWVGYWCIIVGSILGTFVVILVGILADIQVDIKVGAIFGIKVGD